MFNVSAWAIAVLNDSGSVMIACDVYLQRLNTVSALSRIVSTEDFKRSGAHFLKVAAFNLAFHATTSAWASFLRGVITSP